MGDAAGYLPLLLLDLCFCNAHVLSITVRYDRNVRRLTYRALIGTRLVHVLALIWHVVEAGRRS